MREHEHADDLARQRVLDPALMQARVEEARLRAAAEATATVGVERTWGPANVPPTTNRLPLGAPLMADAIYRDHGLAVLGGGVLYCDAASALYIVVECAAAGMGLASKDAFVIAQAVERITPLRRARVYRPDQAERDARAGAIDPIKDCVDVCAEYCRSLEGIDERYDFPADGFIEGSRPIQLFQPSVVVLRTLASVLGTVFCSPSDPLERVLATTLKIMHDPSSKPRASFLAALELSIRARCLQQAAQDAMRTPNTRVFSHQQASVTQHVDAARLARRAFQNLYPAYCGKPSP